MNNLREFGKFRLDVEKKTLWHGEEQISLPLKEVELLCVLTETGELVTKEEIITRIWQGAYIEESNLTSHVYRLRKMFAEHGESENLIKTISKRGYRFTGEVIRFSDTPEIIFEKQTLTQTLVEELDVIEPPLKVLPPKPRQNLFWIPILLGLILVTTTFGYYFYANRKGKAEGVKTIAVAKFSTLSDNEDEKVLALGIKEKLLINLGRVPDLHIQNVNFDESEIGKVENADAILLGNVQKAEGQIRVTLRLLQISDKRQIWSDTFDEPQAGLFKLQDEISQKVTDSLSINLTQLDKESIFKRPTENKDAYENYLQGRYFFNQRGIDYSGSLKKAQPYFEKAVELDPNFAEAYIGLADVINLRADEKNKLNPNYDAEYQKSLQLIAKAFEINPNLAEAHAARGWIQLRYEWKPLDAERSLLKAIELNHGLTNAYIWLSQTYQVLGKTDIAVKNAEKALEIEPTLSRALGNLNSNYFYNEQCDKVMENFKKLIPFYSNTFAKIEEESRILSNCGKCDEAMPLLEELRKQRPDSNTTAHNLGYCHALKNNGEKARQELRILETNRNSGHAIFGRILVHFALGEKEKALEVLRESYKTKDARLLRVLFDPRLKELRNDPGFKEITKDINLGT